MNMENKTKEELLSLSTNLGETALDSILSDGIFKDIPGISSLISVGKLTHSISDYFLFTRIIHFINELNLKNQQEIDELKRKYFSDKDYKKIGSKILLTIERTDDQKKIKWLAKCFRLFLDKTIIKAEFIRLTSILNNAYVDDLEKIIVFDKREEITTHNDLVESYILDHLFSIGLLETFGIDGGNAGGENSGTIYGLNIFGQKIKDLIIK
jgi:hypothetical protein